MGKVSNIDVRIGHANVTEGKEASNPADDTDAWVFDFDTAMGNGTVGVSYYQVNANSLRLRQSYIGVRFAQAFGNIDFNALGIYNFGKRKELTGTVSEHKNTGFAVKGEVKVPVGPAKVGVMGLYATGDKDYSLSSPTVDSSDAFITPMSLVETHGYWGYTGKLNVVGPTDTGIDDPVNIDGGSYTNTNLGRGMTTIQANASFNVVPDKLDGYLAAGWFALNDSADGFDTDLGLDFLAMGTYHFGGNLNLDFGVDYANLGKGHQDSAALGANNGESRQVTLVFSRLQMEF